MRNAKRSLAVAAAAMAAVAATALYARDARQSTGSMMGDGMMGGGGMMGRTSRMMDHCTGMMSSHRHGDRPNGQDAVPSSADVDRIVERSCRY
jgi:hypothetical protein